MSSIIFQLDNSRRFDNKQEISSQLEVDSEQRQSILLSFQLRLDDFFNFDNTTTKLDLS